MKSGRLDNTVETISDRLDSMAKAVSSEEGEDQQEGLSTHGWKQIVKAFPYFLLACTIGWILVVVYTEAYNIPSAINMLCLVFVYAFALLGIPCILYLEKGPFPLWSVLSVTVGLSIALWYLTDHMGEFIYAEAISNILANLGIVVQGTVKTVVGFVGTVGVMFLTTIGVLSVIVAYLSKYIVNVLLSMNGHAKTGTRAKAEAFFDVPDIIDVESVELKLVDSTHIYNFKSSLNLTIYMIIFGMTISSYLFVNPYFLDVMSANTMLSVMTMLSMFMPALIIPWQIVRDVGAHVKSVAPRDYYLWTGAKNRLFSTFMAMGAFMMMFLLSVYLGNDIFYILKNYILYLVPLVATAVMYSFIYSNNFVESLKHFIYREYYERRDQ